MRLVTFTHRKLDLLEVVPVEALDGKFLSRRFVDVRSEILKHLLADVPLRVFGRGFWDSRFIHARCACPIVAGSHSRFAKGVSFTVNKGNHRMFDGFENRYIIFTRPCVRVENLLTCLLAGRSGELNGWSHLDAREEHDPANSLDQVYRAVSSDRLTQLSV